MLTTSYFVSYTYSFSSVHCICVALQYRCHAVANGLVLLLLLCYINITRAWLAKICLKTFKYNEIIVILYSILNVYIPSHGNIVHRTVMYIYPCWSACLTLLFLPALPSYVDFCLASYTSNHPCKCYYKVLYTFFKYSTFNFRLVSLKNVSTFYWLHSRHFTFICTTYVDINWVLLYIADIWGVAIPVNQLVVFHGVSQCGFGRQQRRCVTCGVGKPVSRRWGSR